MKQELLEEINGWLAKDNISFKFAQVQIYINIIIYISNYYM